MNLRDVHDLQVPFTEILQSDIGGIIHSVSIIWRVPALDRDVILGPEEYLMFHVAPIH